MVEILSRDGLVVKPEARVVLLESTMNWSEEMRARGGRFFDVYLFDHRRHVHCCELTASYELHWLTTIYSNQFPDTCEGEIERDQFEMEIMDANRHQPWVEYVHAHSVDASPFIDLSESSISLYDSAHEDYDDEDELHEAILEAIREHLNANMPDYHSLIR